ncbi:hypothetical protein AAFC00_005865 [Neodothiora populina]|uniref:VanZ-like domain-containing protein n=1 Tax=Neodothiora populina TaxID=2781224 RepID=A0ABR3P6E3_9PEZI
MRIRKPFAAAFVILLLIAASLGLAPNRLPQYKQSDKVLHFITFLLITLCFYWILETNRRRVIHLTLLICTAGLSIGSEVVQGLLPNGREFDPYDILANVLGSGLALGACSWYHKRMLERRRAARKYHIVPGEDGDGNDVELGESVGVLGGQESGVIPAADPPNVTEELDNWDENAEDWDDDNVDTADAPKASVGVDAAEGKKRSD